MLLAICLSLMRSRIDYLRTSTSKVWGLLVQGSNSFSKNFPMTFTYWVTDAGVEFVRRFACGIDIA